MNERKYSIYVLIKNKNVIYVGYTYNIPKRRREHSLTKDFDFIKTIARDLTLSEARAAESTLLSFIAHALHMPLINKYGMKDLLLDLHTEKMKEVANA